MEIFVECRQEQINKLLTQTSSLFWRDLQQEAGCGQGRILRLRSINCINKKIKYFLVEIEKSKIASNH